MRLTHIISWVAYTSLSLAAFYWRIMNLRNTLSAITVLGAALFPFSIIMSTAAVTPQANLRYQDRGDRHEGIDKGFPVSDRVELISAAVSYSEKLSEIPDSYNLKFYLDQTEPTFIRVRELDNKYNYWIDQLRPIKPWHQGFENGFQWSTDVVAKAKHIALEDLGVVAQLGSNDPTLDMRVAPVILYSSTYPAKIESYSFTYKIGRKADVTCSFSKDVDNSPLLATQASEVPGQRPRTVDWNVTKLSEGWYRLMITVIYSNNGARVDQVIHFYHRPIVK
jgi:hypothetical protein